MSEKKTDEASEKKKKPARRTKGEVKSTKIIKMQLKKERKEKKIGMLTGICQCCGQQVFFELHGSGYTEDELNEEATKNCTCEGAKLKRRLQRQVEQVKLYVEKEFDGQVERTNLMLDAIDIIERNKADKVDLTIQNVKYTVKFNEKRGTIVKKTVKTEREDTF